MSIEVESLTKIYGHQKAVDDLSFSVQSGEIIGFLGPNGAGKSTTMKMISCYLNPSSGTASVCGHDIHDNPIEVQRSIGYLPESNPLYKDMYIRESLLLCCRIHGMPRPQQRIEEIIQRTGLTKEQNKKIGQLSKGYKQRVGLAQALIHDPQVLILDEPTSGLDPNQLIEIRGLIKSLGQEKTVIFSSHIMQEVQALCQRVLIIHNGVLKVDTAIDALDRYITDEDVVLVRLADPSKDANALDGLPGLMRMTPTEDRALRLSFKKGEGRSDLVFEYCMENQIVLQELRPLQTNVEDVFQQLTSQKV